MPASNAIIHTTAAQHLAFARNVAPLNLSYAQEIEALGVACEHTRAPDVQARLELVRNALACANALEVAMDSVDESDDADQASAARAWAIVLETLRGLK